MGLLLANLLTDALHVCCCLKISIDMHVVSIGITVNACLHVHAQVTFVVIHYGNRDKLRPNRPLGSYTDFTFFTISLS